MGAASIGRIARTHCVALIQGGTDDAEALAGVPLAVTVRIQLLRVGNGRAVVLVVEPVISILVHEASCDPELDGNGPPEDDRHDAGGSDGGDGLAGAYHHH